MTFKEGNKTFLLAEQEECLTIQLSKHHHLLWHTFMKYCSNSINQYTNNKLIYLQSALFKKIVQALETEQQATLTFMEVTMLHDYLDMYQDYVLVEVNLHHTDREEINKVLQLLQSKIKLQQDLYEEAVKYLVLLEGIVI